MTSMSDQELAETEVLLRQRLTQLANHAPTAVHLPDEVAVVAANRPSGRARRFGVDRRSRRVDQRRWFTTYSSSAPATMVVRRHRRRRSRHSCRPWNTKTSSA